MECESWTITNAECLRIGALELWRWKRLLRAPWTSRKSNQSILKKVSPEYSLEGLMLKLKLQYFGHLIRRTDSLERPWCWERLKAGGEGDNREWDGWMASLTRGTWVWVSSGNWWFTGKPGMLNDVAKSQSRLSDWTELNWSPVQQGTLLGPGPRHLRWWQCWAQPHGWIHHLVQFSAVLGHPLWIIWTFNWPYWAVENTMWRMYNTHSVQFFHSFSYFLMVTWVICIIKLPFFKVVAYWFPFGVSAQHWFD